MILREFSRRCKLPDNIFKFDENGITVSFVNNVWVRVEIPIMEILGSGLCTQNEKKCLKKKSSKQERITADSGKNSKQRELKTRSCLVSPSICNAFLRKAVYE